MALREYRVLGKFVVFRVDKEFGDSAEQQFIYELFQKCASAHDIVGNIILAWRGENDKISYYPFPTDFGHDFANVLTYDELLADYTPHNVFCEP